LRARAGALWVSSGCYLSDGDIHLLLTDRGHCIAGTASVRSVRERLGYVSGGLGLDLNTLPVRAVGLGVGIDYGIYLLTRICDEYQSAHNGDVQEAATRAITTTGEAISFIAFTMVMSVLPWYFLSDLRFLAEMGLMLALVMAFNWLLALTLLPLEVMIIKPKFLGRLRLMGH
jgi:MMPL family